MLVSDVLAARTCSYQFDAHIIVNAPQRTEGASCATMGGLHFLVTACALFVVEFITIVIRNDLAYCRWPARITLEHSVQRSAAAVMSNSVASAWPCVTCHDMFLILLVPGRCWLVLQC